MGTVHLFTYGTLVFPEVMEAVAGGRFRNVPATLPDFARRRVRGAVYPGARAEPGARIAGVLYLDVDAAALLRLDRFEGALYERRRVRVVGAGGSCDDAETYVVPVAYADRLEPAPWDPEDFRRDHLASYLARCRSGRAAEEYEG